MAKVLDFAEWNEGKLGTRDHMDRKEKRSMGTLIIKAHIENADPNNDQRVPSNMPAMP